jgi:hypothetical protein
MPFPPDHPGCAEMPQGVFSRDLHIVPKEETVRAYCCADANKAHQSPLKNNLQLHTFFTTLP